VQSFTGLNWREAVILPGETHIFKETSVHHYEALEEPDAESGHL
jgi:hypothetical protein